MARRLGLLSQNPPKVHRWPVFAAAQHKALAVLDKVNSHPLSASKGRVRD